MPLPRKYVFAICGLVLVIGLGFAAFHLDNSPLTIASAPNPEKQATFVLSDRGAGVCVVVDTARIMQSFARQLRDSADFSMQWTNVVAQEVGWFDVIDASVLSAEFLATRHLVILTTSTAHSFSTDQWHVLREFLAHGGAVLVDYPTPATLATLNASVVTRVSADTALPVRPFMVAFTGFDRFGPQTLPVYSPLFKFVATDDSVSFKTAIPDVDAFVDCPIGAGHLFMTGFNMARALSFMQQGRPDEKFRVTNRYTSLGNKDFLEANDLVTDSIFLRSVVPYADVLEKTLFNFIASRIPLPRWATSPGKALGVFVMTHDDEGYGDQCSWMAAEEAQNDYHATTFLMAEERLTRAGVEALQSVGADVALHWNRRTDVDARFYETMGIDSWRPLRRLRNLNAEFAYLVELGARPRANRNHIFLWDSSYTATFRSLHAQGITMESSYGPDLRSAGYIFGTSFPFLPIDSSGATFAAMREVPVSWVENYAHADSVWVEDLLLNNARYYHGVICPLYHSDKPAEKKSEAILESWRHSLRAARRSGHLSITFSELEKFLDARGASAIDWETHGDTLVVSCVATRDSLSLLLDVGISTAVVSAEKYAIDTVAILGHKHLRIGLPAGSTTVKVLRAGLAR